MFDEFVITGRPWLDIALVAAALAIGAIVVHRIVLAVTARYARRHPAVQSLIACTNLPATWLLVFLALQFVLQSAPPDLPHLSLAVHATALGLIGSITWLGMRVAGAVVAIVAVLNPIEAADNLHARRIQTQVRVLTRTLMVLIVLVGAASALMTFPNVRQIGASLLASAGLAGVVAGFAARPVLGNLIAGMQIALTQPLRLDDVLVVEGEWGRVEEIRGAYVVLKIWDERRLIIPLQWLIEHPFQNWTRTGSQILGTVLLWVDFGASLTRLRAEAERICREADEWDGRVAVVQVTDSTERSMQVRVLVSSADAGLNFGLRCKVREGLLEFLRGEQAPALPRLRA
jgi:small-conductance mechanosensitive channel